MNFGSNSVLKFFTQTLFFLFTLQLYQAHLKVQGPVSPPGLLQQSQEDAYYKNYSISKAAFSIVPPRGRPSFGSGDI